MKRDKIFERKKPDGWLLYTCTIITVNNVKIMTHDDNNAAAHDGLPCNITLYFITVDGSHGF